MKKIKLTEKDLVKLVKKIIKEDNIMIQPINESEKNRIRNLHRKQFILNEDDSLSKTKKCAIRNLNIEKVLTTEIEKKINEYVDFNELSDYLQALPVGTGRVINCLTTTLRVHEPEFISLHEETERKRNKMSFMGSTPGVKNEWDAGNGFFGITYEKNGIINSVKNSWNGGSGESQRNSFSSAEKIGIPGNGGSLDNSISFGYVTTVKAYNALSLTLNASSNSGNVSSQTFSTRGPVNKDTIYHGEFILINLPQNSDITITAKGDSENKLVVKTLETVNCDKEWVIIEKALEDSLNKNKSIDIKPYICKKDQTEFIKNQISDIEDRKINCLLSKVKSWCK